MLSFGLGMTKKMHVSVNDVREEDTTTLFRVGLAMMLVVVSL